MTEPKDITALFLEIEIDHARDFKGKLCGHDDCTVCKRRWADHVAERQRDIQWERAN